MMAQYFLRGLEQKARLTVVCWLTAMFCLLGYQPTLAAQEAPATLPVVAPPPAAVAAAAKSDPLIKLGIGDVITIQVYGQPDLSTTTLISDDGTVGVPLAGPVKVAGLSPAAAADAVAHALKDGQFLVNPQVTITTLQFRSQQVSVLGEVRTPGRYPIESRMTVLDLLALAGGTTQNGDNVVSLLRPAADGSVTRYSIDLLSLSSPDQPLSSLAPQAGDIVFVPRAPQFYIYGEVQGPNMYRLEPGMTLVQAISRAGGLTAKGTSSRVEITRHNADGSYKKIEPNLTDLVQANDVIRIKERIFCWLPTICPSSLPRHWRNRSR